MRSKTLNNICVFIYFVFIVNIIAQWFFLPFPSRTHNAITLACGSISLFLIIFFKKEKYCRMPIYLIIALVFGAIFNSFISKTADIGDILLPIGYGGLGMLFFNTRIKNKYAVLPLIFVVAYFICSMVFGVQPANVIKVGSQNNMSTLYLFVLFIYFFTYKKNNKKVSLIFFSFLCLFYIILGVWTASRATLLCGVVFLILVLFERFLLSKKKLRFVLKISIVGIALFLIFRNYFYNIISNMMERINYYGLSSARFDIWSEYYNLTKSNFSYMIFGVNVAEVKSAIIYDGNLHNSLLMLHAHYGIVPFVMVVYLIILSLFKTFKRDKIIFCFMLVYILRIMFDWVSFPGLLDIIFYSVVLFVYQRKKYLTQKSSIYNYRYSCKKT